MQIAVKSGLYGIVVGLLPLLPELLMGDASALRTVQTASNYFLFPGIILGLVLSGGNVHGINPIVMISANCLVYAGLFYAVFRLRQWRSTSGR